MEPYDTISGTVTRILIVDDHALLRDGLKTMLQSFKKELLVQVWEVESGEKALQWMVQHVADLVIIDFKLNGLSGPETTRRMLRFKPDWKLLALSNYKEYDCITAMLEAGARGYVLKSAEPEQLLTAIKTVLSGKMFYCSEVAQVLIEAAEKTGVKADQVYNLTAREIEVLKLIAQELTNKVIAGKLFVSTRTIDKHRQNLLAKLKVKNTAGLVKVAIKLGLL